MTTEEIKSSIDYDFINKWLEYGQRQRLAQEYGIKPNTAYKYLLGIGFNKRFLEACYNTAFENANKWIAYRQQVKSLNDKMAAL